MKETRDRKGQFARGNSGGPGRPKLATESAYLRALTDKCDLDIWGEICDKAVEAAREGDHKAREWLTKYLIGGTAKAAPSLLTIRLEQLSGIDPVCYARAKVIVDGEDDLLDMFGKNKKVEVLAVELTEKAS